MIEHIESMLKPFVNAVHENLQEVISDYTIVRYHYGYGYSLTGFRHWYSDYDLAHLDDLVATEEPNDTTNIDIVLERHISNKNDAYTRFDSTLTIQNERYVIVATSTNVDGQFIVDMDRINNDGFESLAQEFIQREQNVNPYIS